MNKAAFDEIVLAMLWYDQRMTGSAWKGFDWDATRRLFEAELISDPKSKRKSVALSEAGNRVAPDRYTPGTALS